MGDGTNREGLVEEEVLARKSLVSSGQCRSEMTEHRPIKGLAASIPIMVWHRYK